MESTSIRIHSTNYNAYDNNNNKNKDKKIIKIK